MAISPLGCSKPDQHGNCFISVKPIVRAFQGCTEVYPGRRPVQSHSDRNSQKSLIIPGCFSFLPPCSYLVDFSDSRSSQQKDSHSFSQILFSSSSPLLPLPQCLVEREAPFTASLPFIPPRQLTPAFIPRSDGDWMEVAGGVREEAVPSRRMLDLFTLPSLPLPFCRGRREAKTPSLFSSRLLSSFPSTSSALASSLLSSCPFLRRVSFPQRRLAKAARSSRRLGLS